MRKVNRILFLFVVSIFILNFNMPIKVKADTTTGPTQAELDAINSWLNSQMGESAVFNADSVSTADTAFDAAVTGGTGTVFTAFCPEVAAVALVLIAGGAVYANRDELIGTAGQIAYQLKNKGYQIFDGTNYVITPDMAKCINSDMQQLMNTDGKVGIDGKYITYVKIRCNNKDYHATLSADWKAPKIWFQFSSIWEVDFINSCDPANITQNSVNIMDDYYNTIAYPNYKLYVTDLYFSDNTRASTSDILTAPATVTIPSTTVANYKPIDETKTYTVPSALANTSEDSLVGVKTSTATSTDTTTLSDIKTSIEKFFDLSTPIDTSPLNIDGTKLKRVFPFSLPWDLYDSIQCLNVTAQDPDFSADLTQSNLHVKIPVDLSQFTTCFTIIRAFELLFFDIGLIMITRKIMGGDV